MSKEVNKIFCPKCGSTNTRLLKSNYYTCNSCGTEFFIDEVGVNITQNINYNYKNNPPPVVKSKTRISFLVGAFILAFFIIILPRFFSASSKPQEVIAASEKSNLDFNYQADFFGNEANEPIMVISAEKKEAKRAQGDVIAFVNMLSNKVLKTVDIKLPPVDYDHAQEIKQFKNGDIYVIYDKIKIYKVIKKSYSVEDVTTSLFSNQPLMSSGVAVAEFMYRDYGDGFKVKNNEGKELYYYPGIDSIYTDDEKYAASKIAEQIRPSDKLTTGFTFKNQNPKDHHSDVLKVLLRYDERVYNGGPLGKNARNVIDFTPGRTYFNPTVLCFDKSSIVILFSVTPAENALVSMQCLDVNSGAIKWTTPLKEKYIYKGVQYKDGYFLSLGISTLLFDNNGKLINEFKFY